MWGARGEKVLLWLGEQLADSYLLHLALDPSPPFICLNFGNFLWKRHSVEVFAVIGKHFHRIDPVGRDFIYHLISSHLTQDVTPSTTPVCSKSHRTWL